MPFATIALAAPVLAASSLILPASAPATSAAERERLAKGEVVVRLAPADARGLREGLAIRVLDTLPERLARALTDFRHYPEWAPFVARATSRALADGAFEQEQRLDLPAPVTDRHFRLRFHVEAERAAPAAPWQMHWSLVPRSGNLRDHRGAWGLAGLGDGRTLAWCRVYVDPGGLVPAWLVNRTVARSLPWILDGLRQQAHRWRYDPRAPPDAP